VALLAIVVCLALNAFFVAAEFALVKVRVTQITPRARRGERRAVAAKKVLERLDRFLSVTQLGITVASLGLGWIGEPAISGAANAVAMRVSGRPLGDTGHVLVDIAALAVLTYAHLLLGELVPKFIAIQKSEATVLASAIPLRVVDYACKPILWFLEKSQRAVLRVLGLRSDGVTEGTLSEEEILGILAAHAAQSPDGRGKEQILERTMRFARRPVRLSMVPRIDVFSLPVETSGAEAYARIQQQQFSRIPLTRGASPDEVVGYLYAKDFFLRGSAQSLPDLTSLRREALVVPETAFGLDVLRKMQRSRTPFAVVVDEYGGTSGVVTMEDLVEEVVGEIRDELDDEPPAMTALGGAAWEVDGGMAMEELAQLGVSVDDLGRAESVGAEVLGRLGRVPRVGDEIALTDGTRLQVSAMAKRRVQRVRVLRMA